MRFGIATKVFLGFSAILAMSALVSVFGIVQMHQIGQGLALVSTGYFPLSPLAGSLAAYEKERERSTERLLEERDAKVRRSLLRLDRTEFARIADDFLTRARTHIATARESASPRDRQALEKIDTRLSLLAARIAADVVAVPEGGGDELAVLAHEFNAMAQRLAARERELRAQGEALVRSERLAAIGRIAAQITHEIRNPLSSISLNAEELGERLRGSQEPGAAALCDAIVREVDRLAVVTEEYLRYARLPKPQLVRAELNEAVRDLLDFVRPELTSAGISLEQRLAGHLPEVLADVGQVRQLLLNLIRNSREAMPGGGAVFVGTRFADGDVFVELRDTGPGIPPERLGRIFDPFFTTKERGTGLGLALAQEIAQEHSGQLTASSIAGQGTTFTLRLPRAPESRAALAAASPAEIARTG